MNILQKYVVLTYAEKWIKTVLDGKFVMQEYEPPHMRLILYTVTQNSDKIHVLKWKSDTQITQTLCTE